MQYATKQSMGQRGGGINGNFKNIKLNENEKRIYQNMWGKAVMVFRGKFLALSAYIRKKKASN